MNNFALLQERFCNFNAMYLLISLCYFTAKGQIAGTQHYRNRHIRSRYDISRKQRLIGVFSHILKTIIKIFIRTPHVFTTM